MEKPPHIVAHIIVMVSSRFPASDGIYVQNHMMEKEMQP
jgi:hypothetical protein